MHASELIESLSSNAGRAALVIVVEVKGSSPRHPGSKMVVFPDGTFKGTVGGGVVEAKAIARGVESIVSGRGSQITVEMIGEKAAGSDPICGGVVTLAVFPVVDATAYAAAADCLGRGERVVIVSSLSGDTGAASNTAAAGCVVAVVGSDGRSFFGAGAKIDDEAARAAFESGMPVVSPVDSLLYDPVAPLDRLLILGGGHVGQALARFAAKLEFSVCVSDFRPEMLDPARFPAGTELRLGNFTESITGYPFGSSTYAVVVSPSHSTDLECARAILKREYRYAGFIGSKRKTRMILDQAIADGFPPDKVLALRAPIGADIGAETPAEIAVAILTEIIAVRRNSPAIIAIDADRVRRRAL